MTRMMRNRNIRLSIALVWAALLVLLWHSWRGPLEEPPAGDENIGGPTADAGNPMAVSRATIGREVLAVVTDTRSGEDHSMATSSLADLVKQHQTLIPSDIKSLLAFIAAPKPGDLTDGEWEERVNVILNLLRQQAGGGVSSGQFQVSSGADGAVPGLTEYLLETAEKNPSKVLRLYAMQHLSLWFAKESDPAKRRAMVGLLEKLACEPGGDTAGCAVLMLADMRRKETEDAETPVVALRAMTGRQDSRQEGAGSLASPGARVVTNAPTMGEDGVDWGAVDELVGRESGRIIGDREAPQDVRISAIHACVDRKDAEPLPELRNIAADKSLVSTLRKAAIHAIGQLGDDEDLTLLESLSGDDGNLLPAVGPARSALKKRKAETK
jgi:hypothetical protein